MKAIVFVDVQNDFVKGGKLAFAYPEQDNVPDIIKFAKECRAKGYMLYATADTHVQTVYDNYDSANPKPIAGYRTTLEGRKLPVDHCIEGTDGHKIVQGLVKDENNDVIILQGHIIDKPTFGSFDLLQALRDDFGYEDGAGKLEDGDLGEPLDEIVVVGFCTSICVVSNALMLRAAYPNVKITVYDNLCGDINEESHEAALQVMKNCQIDIASWNK